MFVVIQAAHRQPSVTTPATAPAYNTVCGKKQFENQRNTSSVGIGTRGGYPQAFGTISASELASLQGKKL